MIKIHLPAVMETRVDMQKICNSPDPQSSDLGSKLRSDRVAELLDRKRALQSALRSRLVDLKKLCLQEAELTGELPNEYPLQSGERPPHVRRRVGGSYRVPSTLNAKGEELTGELPNEYPLQSGERPPHVRRRVGGSYRVPSTLNAKGEQQIVEAARQLAGGAEPGAEQRRRRRQVLSSATRRLQELEELINEQQAKLGRKPTQRAARLQQDDCFHSENSSLSDSTSHENEEMAAVPARSFERAGCPNSARTRRSNSTEALLDRSVFQEPGGRRGGGAGLAVRGPFKSSETLSDGKLRQPECYESGVRGSVSGRCGTSYNEILLDYVWEKQQQMQQFQAGRTWVEFQPASPAPPQPTNGCPPLPSHRDFAPSPTNHGRFYSGFQNNSPLLRGRGELRRVKVTRTKSCGPFIPLQEQQQNHQLRHPPCQRQHQEGIRDFEAPSDGRDELPWSSGRGEESSHVLHKALALEGLRDWYIRNALAHSGTGQPPQGRGQDFGRRRLHQQPPRQSQSDQSCHGPHQQLSQSVSFHGNPLHSRWVVNKLFRDLLKKR
ncbi:UNVERIFIED_CONTAM: hypothetical protein FKN15_025101 [Acipenser sinensis]